MQRLALSALCLLGVFGCGNLFQEPQAPAAEPDPLADASSAKRLAADQTWISDQAWPFFDRKGLAPGQAPDQFYGVDAKSGEPPDEVTITGGPNVFQLTRGAPGSARKRQIGVGLTQGGRLHVAWHPLLDDKDLSFYVSVYQRRNNEIHARTAKYGSRDVTYEDGTISEGRREGDRGLVGKWEMSEGEDRTAILDIDPVPDHPDLYKCREIIEITGTSTRTSYVGVGLAVPDGIACAWQERSYVTANRSGSNANAIGLAVFDVSDGKLTGRRATLSENDKEAPSGAEIIVAKSAMSAGVSAAATAKRSMTPAEQADEFGWLAANDHDPTGAPWEVPGPRCTNAAGCAKRCAAGEPSACAWLISRSMLKDWLACSGTSFDINDCVMLADVLAKRPPDSDAMRRLHEAALRLFDDRCEKGYRSFCHDAAKLLFATSPAARAALPRVRVRLGATCRASPDLCDFSAAALDTDESRALCAQGFATACARFVPRDAAARAAAEQACANGSGVACSALSETTDWAARCRAGSVGACREWWLRAGMSDPSHPSVIALRDGCSAGRPAFCEAFSPMRETSASPRVAGVAAACAKRSAISCLLVDWMKLTKKEQATFADQGPALLRLCEEGFGHACSAAAVTNPEPEVARAVLSACDAGAPSGCALGSAIYKQRGEQQRAETLRVKTCGLFWTADCQQGPPDRRTLAHFAACHRGVADACTAFATAWGAALLQKGDGGAAADVVFRMSQRALSLNPKEGTEKNAPAPPPKTGP